MIGKILLKLSEKIETQKLSKKERIMEMGRQSRKWSQSTNTKADLKHYA